MSVAFIYSYVYHFGVYVYICTYVLIYTYIWHFSFITLETVDIVINLAVIV